LIILLLPAAMIATPAAALEAGPKPVAKVNSVILTERDLQAAFNEIIPAGVFHRGFSASRKSRYRHKAIDRMVETELFYQAAIAKGLKIDEAVVERQRNRTIQRLGGEFKFRAALKKAHLTDLQYRGKLRKKFLVKRIIANDISARARATDEEIRSYYYDNKSRFMRPEARRLTHILIAVKPEASTDDRNLKRQGAQDVRDKIMAGEDMSVMAWNFSDGPYRVKGGDLGLVHKGRLDRDLEIEVFRLETGELSAIIETYRGYHIVRVEAVRAPEQLSLDAVYGKIKKDLSAKKEQQLRRELVTRLRAKAEIELY